MLGLPNMNRILQAMSYIVEEDLCQDSLTRPVFCSEDVYGKRECVVCGYSCEGMRALFVGTHVKASVKKCPRA